MNQPQALRRGTPGVLSFRCPARRRPQESAVTGPGAQLAARKNNSRVTALP